MTTRNTSSQPLTRLQQSILDLLSTHGPAASEELRARLRAKHPLSDSSMRTLLRRLEARGLVSHRVDGKVFIYRAEVAPRRVAADAVRRMIQNFWSGSAEQFLAGLVDERVLSADELQRLAAKVKKGRDRA